MTASRIEHLAEGVTLHLGDSREILPTLGRVDHAITDPPYEREAHDSGRRLNGRTIELKDKRVREIDTSPIDFAPMTPELRNEVSAAFGALCGGWVLIFCQAEAVQTWRESLEAGDCAYRRAMVWVKPDSAPQLSGDRPAQGYESIVAAWAGDGRSKWNGGGKRGVLTHCKHDPSFGHGGAVNGHQTRKPISLMLELVELFTTRGEIILDPFMGSGTTGVAAVQRGRKFIGIEREEKYFEMSLKRIDEALCRPDMFIELPKRLDRDRGAGTLFAEVKE